MSGETFPGLLIVLEGIDASGKATQAPLLRANLEALGRRAVVLSFPDYSTPSGKAIAGLLRGYWEPAALTGGAHQFPVPSARPGGEFGGFSAEGQALLEGVVLQSLMLANFAEVASDIRETLRDGADVICDRFWGSLVAFGIAEGLGLPWLLRLSSALPRPDAWIVLDVTPEESARRSAARGKPDRNERDLAKLRRARDAYLRLCLGGEGPPAFDAAGVVAATQEILRRGWKLDGEGIVSRTGGDLRPSAVVLADRAPEQVAAAVLSALRRLVQRVPAGNVSRHRVRSAAHRTTTDVSHVCVDCSARYPSEEWARGCFAPLDPREGEG